MGAAASHVNHHAAAVIDNAAVPLIKRSAVPYWVVDDRSPSSIMLIMASSCDLNPAGSSGKLSGAAVAQRQHRQPQDAASSDRSYVGARLQVRRE